MIIRTENDDVRSVDGMTDDEITELIERSCWRTHVALSEFVGGRGNFAERRQALQTAFDVENAADIKNAARIASNLAEADALEPFYETVRLLAKLRHERDPAKSEGEHIRDLARSIDIHLAALADTVDAV